MLDRLERIPEVGDSLIVDGIRVEVLAVDGFAIERIDCRVDPDSLDDSDEDDRSSRADDVGRATRSSDDRLAATDGIQVNWTGIAASRSCCSR